jgi:Uma2 family endonuclease
MIVFAPIFENKPKEQIPFPKYDGIQMRFEDFQNFETEEPRFKYEWNDGILEAEERMKFNEQRIVFNLQRKFSETSTYQKGDALLAEVECFFKKINKIRIPDLCYLTSFQIKNSDKATTNQVPIFIIEIISKTNSGIDIERKNNEYIESGVKVLWNIYPELKVVIIHYSQTDIKKRMNSDICDAGDVIPDFQISVSEIFE